MLLGTELMGAPVQHPATPTTNAGIGAGLQRVLLHVCKELLSPLSQPVGHFCATCFVYLAPTFGDWPPESSPLIV